MNIPKLCAVKIHKAKTESQEEMEKLVLRLGNFNTVLSEANRLSWQEKSH